MLRSWYLQDIPSLLATSHSARLALRQQVIVGPVPAHLLHAFFVRGQILDLVVGGQVRGGEVLQAVLGVPLQQGVLGRRRVAGEEGRLLAALVVRVAAGPRADDPLDEVAHGKEQQQDQDAGQLARKPANVVEEDVDGELAAAHRRAAAAAAAAVPREAGRAAPLAVAALALVAEGSTGGDQARREEGAGGPAAAQHAGDHCCISRGGDRRALCPRCWRLLTGLPRSPAVR